MKKWIISCLAIPLGVVWVLLGSVSAEEKVSVSVSSAKGEQIRPDLDTTSVELGFSQTEEGSAYIQLHSPQKNFFSPTDFPWVEDTELIAATIMIRDGKASFDYMFPIRGDYSMKVEIRDLDGNLVGTENLGIHIGENPQEMKNAIIFIVLLVLFGLISGYVLSKRRMKAHAI